jgi:hypothetical protein
VRRERERERREKEHEETIQEGFECVKIDRLPY